MTTFPAIYRAVYVDSPWSHNNYGMAKHGAAKANYDEQGLDWLCDLPVGELAHPEWSVCLSWCTGPKAAEDHHSAVLRAWGFRSVTKAFCWVKCQWKCRSCGHGWDEHLPDLTYKNPRGACVRCESCSAFNPKPYFGTGNYTGGGTEDCWLGVRGSGASKNRLQRDVRHIVVAPLPRYPGTKRPKHSAKPIEVVRRIEQLWHGPYVELFARSRRPGWDTWGSDEVEHTLRLERP